MSAAVAQYSIEDARRDLEALAARARAGESIQLISSDGQVVAVIGPPTARPAGRVGRMRGTLTVVGDDQASTSPEWSEPA